MWKDCETNIDLLDFDYLINITEQIILNKSLSPSTIGIYGDWGSGKSSLMNMVRCSLEAKRDSKILCIKYNGWLFESYEDAKTALLGTILDEIKKKRTLSAKAKEKITQLFKSIDYFKLASKGIKYGVDYLLTGGIGTIADLSVGVIAKTLGKAISEAEEEDIKSALEVSLKNTNIREDLKSFHEDFAELLKETKIEHIVIFIDELDRCSHDTILESLEAIRLFIFAKGTSFVIGADERQIQYAVKKKYPEIEGNRIDISKEYLEKLIQYPIRIPQLGRKEVQQYITCLFLESELEEEEFTAVTEIIKMGKGENFLTFELTYDYIKAKNIELAEKVKDTLFLSRQLSSILSMELNGNPRHCKRFLNALSLRMSMADIKGISLDRKVLAKLMLLEYFKDGFYRALAGTPDNTELKIIEDGDKNYLNLFQAWKDDEWIDNWIKIDPKLTEVDLKPYFYFARESLRSGIISNNISLSPAAEEVLRLLLEGNDSATTSAIAKSVNISDGESKIIEKELFTSISSITDISVNLFSGYLKFVAEKDCLFAEAINNLESLPASTMKASFIPHFSHLLGKLPDHKKLISILNKWGDDNPKLANAVAFLTDAKRMSKRK
jgi:predicted KAP-like P-loop ATPase